MAAVTKNIYVSHCVLLIYYMSKRVQILTAGTWQWVVQQIFQTVCEFLFSRIYTYYA